MAPLIEDEDETIFSNRYPLGNQAIVKQGLTIIRAKPDKKTAMVEDSEAKSILTAIHRKIMSRKQKYQRLDHPFFNVPDYYGGKQGAPIGGFSYHNED